MTTIRVTAGVLLVALSFSAACATKFKAAPDAGTGAPSGINGASGGSTGGGQQPTPGATGGSASVPTATGGSSATPPSGGSGSVPTATGGAIATATAGMGAVGTSGTGSVQMPTAGSGAPSAGNGSAGAPPAQIVCPSTVMPAGETNGMISVGGVNRTYILHVPRGYTGKTPIPLVTDWHPILFTGTTEQGVSGYQALADQEGFVVVWPNGIDNAWNIGDCCTTSRTVDDVGFARALVAKLEQQLCIDPKRVYATGYSMGGGMSYKLACDATDLVAAVAPAAFELMEESEWPCKPSRPITVISTNGTGDGVVPYNGGDTSPPNGLPVVNHFLGAPKTFQKWAMLNGCTDQPMDKGGGCQTYSQCMAGVEVTLCTVQGGGHLPGDAATEWATLKRFTLP